MTFKVTMANGAEHFVNAESAEAARTHVETCRFTLGVALRDHRAMKVHPDQRPALERHVERMLAELNGFGEITSVEPVYKQRPPDGSDAQRLGIAYEFVGDRRKAG